MTILQEQLAEVKALLKTRAFSLYRANKQGHLGGPKVRELEALFCDYFKVKYAVAMNSATSCLHSACVALNGREVITTPVTFSATTSAILMAGGEVRFADIQPDIYCLNALQIKPSDKTTTIIPVHLHGHPADMDRLMFVARHYKLNVIEDCAQALGAIYYGKKVGTIGDCGVFSFNQWKQIQSGEGGMLITDCEEIAEKVRLIRNHGETQSLILGYNFRMTELQAAVLIPQFRRLDDINQKNTELAECLTYELKDIWELGLPITYPDCQHIYYTYPVYCEGKRDALQAELLKQGIYFGQGGYTPLYKFPFYKQYQDYFPVAEDCYQNVMFTNQLRSYTNYKQVKRMARIIKESLWRINH